MKYLIIILSVTLLCCKDRKHAHTVSTTRDTGYALYVNPIPSVAGCNKLVNLTDSLKGYIGDRDTFFISDVKIKRGVGWKRIKLNGDWTLEGGNSYGAFTRDGKLVTSDSLPTTIDMGGYLVSVDTTKGWFKHFNYKPGDFVGLDTTWPTVYSNKAKIVDSGEVTFRLVTDKQWFQRHGSFRFDTTGGSYEFSEISISEIMKGKYKQLCYLKPDSAWVIKDSVALFQFFFK